MTTTRPLAIVVFVLVCSCSGGPSLISRQDAWEYRQAPADADAGQEDASAGVDAFDTEIGLPGDLSDAPVPDTWTDVEPEVSTGGTPDSPPEGTPDAPASDLPADTWEAAFPDLPYTGEYAGVGNLSGQALFTKLCSMVHSGYKGVSYDKASDLLRDDVDNQGGKVQGVYTGAWFSGGKGLNVEHSWPQSLGATGEAKSDMFHLFMSEPSFNSARGNLPFGVVAVPDWPEEPVGNPACTDHFPDHPAGCFSVRGKDASGVKVFEPRDAHKGDVARAIFYFSLRYGSSCKAKPLNQFDPAHPATTESVLKLWNAKDLPDDTERGRNDRIENYQQIRNPFIDHPELLEKLTFQ